MKWDPIGDVYRAIKYGEVDLTNDDEFNKLALPLVLEQYESNSVYRRYVDLKVKTYGLRGPDHWLTWEDIVALPVSYFKKAKVVTTRGPYERVWESSGTTGDKSLTHLTTTNFYELVIDKEREMFLPDVGLVNSIGLIPTADEWPDSSLAFMFDRLYGETSEVEMIEGSRDFRLDEGRIRFMLTSSVQSSIPVVLYGTSYGFVKLFEWMGEHNLFYNLPNGSYMVDTGGFKGFTQPITRGEMVSLAIAHLNLDPELCINEYGMSEMSSQLWQCGVLNDHVMPPWMRAKAVDPLNGRKSSRGLLTFFDLANIWSSMALETEDVGSVNGQSVRVEGRVKGSSLKGCSVTASERMKV